MDFMIEGKRIVLYVNMVMNNSRATQMTEGQIATASQLFAALSEPARLRLIQSLMCADLTVSEIMQATGLKQANVSKHLGILFRAGLVTRSKEGTFARYSVTDPFLKEICSVVCGRMERQALDHLASLRKP
jgi:DNA-binding transcriptional ArsR family regulator